ncbi:MAG: LacI family transcriptional regulator [Streptococcaceae bacterium]|jgi:LacI family transcriptional regulator|nr:LacI family transcriptional regulator [Streptococcaceae bacterium]
MNKITIREVAKVAGVSVSTVSQVFNNYTAISQATRDRVKQVATELGYAPNLAARSLAAKKKKTIALVLNEINVVRGVAMPLEILNGVIEMLDETDYEFVFYATNLKKQQEKSLAHFLNEHALAGVIIQGLKTSDPYYQELKTINFPVVIIDMEIENPKIGKVSIDNEQACFEVGERLKQAGHLRVCFVNGSKDAAVSQEREVGIRKSLPDVEVVYANFSEKEAYEWAMVFGQIEKFSAIFAASDLMAIGIIKALKNRGLEDKIALIGFDDITLASYVSPTLTTVRQDATEKARQATDNLIHQIEQGEVKNSVQPYEIIVRESAEI